jgi:hypothetical protein
MVNFFVKKKVKWCQTSLFLQLSFAAIDQISSNPMSFSLNPSSSLMRLSTFAIPWHNETGSRRKLTKDGLHVHNSHFSPIQARDLSGYSFLIKIPIHSIA